METLEKQFATLVKEQKSTIYSICYMFSKDKDGISAKNVSVRLVRIREQLKKQ